MYQIKKTLRTKLSRLSLGKEGRRGKLDDVKSSLTSKSKVYEEYKEAFRTKSYIEIRNKIHDKLEARTSLDGGSSSSSSSSPIKHTPLSEYLLEPDREILTSIIENSNLHQFLINYFEISLEASKICESLLTNIHRVRLSHRSIKNVIKLIKRAPDPTSWTGDQYGAVCSNLASFALHKNPFSTMTPENFHQFHETHLVLLHELISQCRKTKTRSKLISFIKRVLAGILVTGSVVLAVALLALAMHTMVAMVAAPGLVLCSSRLFTRKKIERAKQRCSRRWLEGLVEQLDIAARGVYILINDFDTLSRLVQRLNDEVEHRKFVAHICVKKGKNEMLKDVVREFQMQEARFLEQLEELERQVCLCFLDINRSRRVVAEEIMKC